MSDPHPRVSLLPPSLPPRGLSRHQAAEYIGVSPSLFDEMVADHRMPPPKRINARTVWDRGQLDVAFTALNEEEMSASSEIDRMLDASSSTRR